MSSHNQRPLITPLENSMETDSNHCILSTLGTNYTFFHILQCTDGNTLIALKLFYSDGYLFSLDRSQNTYIKTTLLFDEKYIYI